jgi:hypothetical protein
MAYKLGKTVLAEIVMLFMHGINEGEDVSDQMRSLEVEPDPDETGQLRLASEYRNHVGQCSSCSRRAGS